MSNYSTSAVPEGHAVVQPAVQKKKVRPISKWELLHDVFHMPASCVQSFTSAERMVDTLIKVENPNRFGSLCAVPLSEQMQ